VLKLITSKGRKESALREWLWTNHVMTNKNRKITCTMHSIAYGIRQPSKSKHSGQVMPTNKLAKISCIMYRNSSIKKDAFLTGGFHYSTSTTCPTSLINHWNFKLLPFNKFALPNKWLWIGYQYSSNNYSAFTVKVESKENAMFSP